MIPVTPQRSHRARSEHARQLRWALIARLSPADRPAPRASSVVIMLTMAAMLVGTIVWVVAQYLAGAQ
jgi:hypothetical protein